LTKNQNSAKIKVLGDLDHVRTRPEMYIGSMYDYSHLITEVFDNALDELANGYATAVQLNVTDNSIVEVMDNGRGIPIHSVEGYDYDSIVLSATKLFSGAKFDDKAYGVAIGLHGVGLAVTNALSEFMEIHVAKNNTIYLYKFVNSNFISVEKRSRKEGDPSTFVRFKPNLKYFNTSKINLEPFRKRMYLISARVQNSTLVLNGEVIPQISQDELARFYLNIEKDHHLTNVVINRGNENATVFITCDNEKISFGDINLNICTGTYLTTITTLFVKTVMKKYPSLTRANITNGLKIYCSAFIKDPRYEGQVKHKMVKDISPFLNMLIPKFETLINTPFFKEHFQNIVDSKINSSAAKKLKRTAMVGVGNPLMDCTTRPGKTCYILEGDSAGGTVRKFRDARTEAIFPLSGKILNTIKKNISEALDSKKMKYLLEAIGVDLSKRKSNYRYDEFKVLCDGDCLSYENIITYFDKDGHVRTCMIGELSSKEAGNINQCKVISRNLKTNEFELKPIIGLLEKPYRGQQMIRVHTKNMHHNTFTEDHIIFVNRNGNLMETPASEIRPGDILVSSGLDIIESSNTTNPIVEIRSEILKVTKVETVGYRYDYLYDLIIQDNSNFCCGYENILVHNCDGGHIAVLVLLAIYRFAPDIIKQGKLKIILPPLYGTYVGKTFIPIYNDTDLATYRSKGNEIIRFKGLGEMDSKQLETVIRSGQYEYQVKYPKNKDIEDAVITCITDTDAKRHLCNNVDLYNINRIFDAI